MRRILRKCLIGNVLPTKNERVNYDTRLTLKLTRNVDVRSVKGAEESMDQRLLPVQAPYQCFHKA
jgi:hypothetical protein